MATPHPTLKQRYNTYNFRNRETDPAPPMPKKEFGRRRFNYNATMHWNFLPHEAKIAESVISFKSKRNEANVKGSPPTNF